jgi:hypothetical protein
MKCCRGVLCSQKEKKVHKKKFWKYNEDTLQDLGNLVSINKSRLFYQELNQSHKDEVGRR